MLTVGEKKFYKNYEASLDEDPRYSTERDERDSTGYRRGKAPGSWWHYVYAVIDGDVYLTRWEPTASAGDLHSWAKRHFERFTITKYRDKEHARDLLARQERPLP